MRKHHQMHFSCHIFFFFFCTMLKGCKTSRLEKLVWSEACALQLYHSVEPVSHISAAEMYPENGRGGPGGKKTGGGSVRSLDKARDGLIESMC